MFPFVRAKNLVHQRRAQLPAGDRFPKTIKYCRARECRLAARFELRMPEHAKQKAAGLSTESLDAVVVGTAGFNPQTLSQFTDAPTVR